jgi:uncharacterized protein
MNAAQPIRYLVLFVTGACNLRCRYCYASKVPTLTMSLPFASRALELTAASGGRFHVQLTGGEPTLAPETVEHIVSMIREKRMNATIGLQTNGTLLDDALIEILVRHEVEIGLSLDGVEAVHNRERGRFKETIRGLTLLMRRQVPCRVTTVVTASSAPHLDKLALMLAGFPNVRGIGLDLLTLRGSAVSNGVSPVSVEPLRDSVENLRKALAFVNRNRAAPLVVRELGGSGVSTPAKCHAAKGESLAVLPDGRLFPCSQTAGDPEYCMGDLDRGIGYAPKTLDEGPDCPSRTHYNRGENLPLSRLFASERMSR